MTTSPTAVRPAGSTVVFVGHRERSDAAAVASHAADWLEQQGLHVAATPEDARSLGISDRVTATGPEESLDDVCLVISIGGDGTMLRAVALLRGLPVPVLGVNAGLLGYLAEVEPEQVIPALERYFSGDFTLEHRMVLDVTVRQRDGRQSRWRALNEASVEKTKSGQTIRLGVSIDGVPFTTFQADGLLVATPTGSTAYSLSARGPIVSPAHRALIVTPLAPHMLFDRSLVLEPSEVVDIEVAGPHQAELAIDGQEVDILQAGDSLTCRAADEPAVFVRLEPRRFHQVLKNKFGLADR
jgi:NAD+ kinase